MLRAFCLGLIVVQNSSLILVTSYSRTLVPAFLPSVAIFFSEIAKLAAALALLAHENGSWRHARQSVSALLAEHSRDTIQFALPAACYTLQNFLWYYALGNLDPITAAVTSQMKVMTTAVASVLMLGRRLSALQWIALAMLTFGIVLMQLPAQQQQQQHQQQRQVPQNTMSGAGAMLLSTVLSACEPLTPTLTLTLTPCSSLRSSPHVSPRALPPA